MDWVLAVLKSEFLWGTVLGVVLSVLTARATLYFQSRQQYKTVISFASDLVSNMQDYARALDENRERSRVIFIDILALIENEIGIWARNREHLIYITEDHKRKLIRDYFSRSAKLTVDIKIAIDEFNNFHRLAEQNSEGIDGPNRSISSHALSAAHQQCDRLVAHINNPPSI